MLQKTYVTDFLTKKKKVNEGELPKYYIEGGHPAIIDPADWDVVQEEIAHRKTVGNSYSSHTFLSSRLICENCGNYYGSKVWHSTDKYRRVIYRCNKKYDNGAKCNTPHITEEEVKGAFIKAYNLYMSDRDQIIEDLTELCTLLNKTDSIEDKLRILTDDLKETADYYKLLIAQDDNSAENKLKEEKAYKKYLKLHAEVEKVTNKLTDIKNRNTKLQNYIEGIRTKPNLIEKWDNRLWVSMIHHCVVHKDKTLTFVFRDESEITI